MDPAFLSTYSQGGMTCSFVLMPTEEAYYLTYGSGETTVIANGEEFDILVVEYNYDDWEDDEWVDIEEESLPDMEFWADADEMKDSGIYTHLTGAGLQLTEKTYEMAGEWYRYEIVESYPGELIYI